MDAPLKKFYVIVLLLSVALARTLRYQIVTRDDGQKEILSNQLGTPISTDLEFLAKDLNLSLKKVQESSKEDTLETTTPQEPGKFPDEKYENLKEDNHQLMNKWNSYTANGWTGQKNAVYANSTKLVILSEDPIDKIIQPEVKQGRSENFTKTTDVIEVPIDEPGLWEVIERLYKCFNGDSKHESTLECLKSRVTNMILKFLDTSLSSTAGKSGQMKTLVHGKKVLKGALLPLLVLLIIKYLVALPVIAAGLITIKTFWLSLLSAGVAAFGPWKHGNIVKRYRPDSEHHTTWNQPPAWTAALYPEAMEKFAAGTEKYFM